MLFYSYKSMLELTQRFSPFIELQYCKARQGEKPRKIVSVRHLKYNQADSLYISSDDMYKFFDCYSEIFQNGIYNNLRSGRMDLYGINYYSPTQMKDIISRLEQAKPEDYINLLQWLKHGMDYNGFYILGI